MTSMISATNLSSVPHPGIAEVLIAFASSSSENKGVNANRVPNVPVVGAAIEHQSIQREPTLNISVFISPQLEFESVLEPFIPDVDSDGNRLSAILD